MTNALGMFIAVLFVTSWLRPTTKRRICGYALWFDIGSHVVLQMLFSGTGEERIAMLWAGIGVNLWLHAYRMAWGYERLQGTKWYRTFGRFTRHAA